MCSKRPWLLYPPISSQAQWGEGWGGGEAVATANPHPPPGLPAPMRDDPIAPSPLPLPPHRGTRCPTGEGARLPPP
jgi:hypothetical protein